MIFPVAADVSGAVAGVVPNIPRLFTALAEWTACLLYILKYRPRTGRRSWRIPMALAAMLPVQCVFLALTGPLPLSWWFPCMGVAALLMLLLIWSCCELSFPAAVYVTVRAFLLAEFAASLEWQLFYYAAPRLGLTGWPAALLFLAAVYGALFGLMYALESRQENPEAVRTLRPAELWVPLSIALAAFLISNLSFVLSNTPFSTAVIGDIHTIRTLVDLAGLAALYAYHIQRAQQATREELAAIRNILRTQYAQYQQSRESIDLINRKYHDLKHQIAVLRAETDPERRSAFLDGMEEEIRDYEAQNKTGNPVLDTVLTSKSLYCARHGIELTCVADGTLLDFLSAADLCTVFGNILDNAIECQMGIADKGKRLIHLMIYNRKELLVIRCENYCERPPALSPGGLPATTKSDAANHGYGLKSVRYTAEKYGGTLTVNTRENWFELNIVIPIPERA